MAAAVNTGLWLATRLLKLKDGALSQAVRLREHPLIGKAIHELASDKLWQVVAVDRDNWCGPFLTAILESKLGAQVMVVIDSATCASTPVQVAHQNFLRDFKVVD